MFVFCVIMTTGLEYIPTFLLNPSYGILTLSYSPP